jgi:hypothetical protein
MTESGSNKGYNRWTDEMKHRLAQLVLRYKGYKKTTGETMESKWQTINDMLLADGEFMKLVPVGLKLDSKSLHQNFRRFSDAVLDKFGISAEGANLSGLPEEPSPYELLMVNMAQEVAETKCAKVGLKEKKMKLQENLLTHEKGGLLAQNKITQSSTSLLPAVEDVSTPDDNVVNRVELDSITDSSSLKSGNKKRGATFFDQFDRATFDLFEETPEIQNLTKVKLEKEIEAIERQHVREERQTDLNDRLLKLQEDQLEFNRQEALSRAENSATTKALIELIAKLSDKK